MVFFSQGGQIHAHAGQINVTSVTHGARDEHLAADAGTINAEYLQADQATIDQDGVALVNVFGKAWIVDVHAAYAFLGDSANALGAGEFKDFVLFQLKSFRDVTCTYFRALHIHHNRDVSADFITDLTHSLDDLSGPCMVGVCHINSADIDASFD